MSHGHREHHNHRSSERRFERYITRIDGKPLGCRRLFCAGEGCGQQGEILDRSESGFPPAMIEKKFNQKGWEVGTNEKHDYCPSCVEARRVSRRTARVKPLPSNVVSLVTPTKPVLSLPQQESPMSSSSLTTAPEPEQMGLHYRRTIFAKLQDVYVDETQGYQTPWTDQAVAKDLGCPLAWVMKIRDENFGPAADNSEIRAMLGRVETGAREAKALIDEVKLIRKDATALVERVNDVCKRAGEIGKNLDGLLATADRISQAVRL